MAADAHAHESESGDDKTLMGLKIALIIILFFIVYLGLIPAYSKYCRSSQLTLSLMNCFAGGVFLAMAFIHILPEAVEQYYGAMLGEEDAHGGHRLLQAAGNTTLATPAAEEEEHADRHGIFPLPYLMFFVGYCIILLIDRVFAGEHGHSHSHGNDDHHHLDEEKAKVTVPEAEKSPNSKLEKNPGVSPVLVVEDIKDDLKVLD